MMLSDSGPGKTSPRLYYDLLSYNPYNKGINVLSSLPPHYNDAYSRQKNYLRCGHKHRLSLKPNQSLPTSGPDVPQLVTAICRECRLHFKLELTVEDAAGYGGFKPRICPTEASPLHHFRYEPRLSDPIVDLVEQPLSSDPPEREDVKVFSCTTPQCGARLKITLSAQRVNRDFRDLITSGTKLQARFQKSLRLYKEKSNDTGPTPQAATPTKALHTLRAYLQNVIKIPEQRHIPVNNPRFVECLGDDGTPIMQRMGFTLNEAGTEWIPPLLPQQSTPYTDETWKLYDDWISELTILLDNMKGSSGADEMIFSFIPVEAEEHFKKVIGCFNYEKRVRVVDLSKEEHPYYASLGAVDDLSDKLLLWAYNRQKECDESNRPYYLECLNDLARGRRSEELQMEVATLRSQGEYTLQDVKEAYNAIGVKQNCREEDLIIGIFNARVLDAPRQEAPLRQSLNLIGQYINSPRVLEASMKLITDVRQAYERLGVERATEASLVITHFEVNLADQPGDEVQLREALKCIALDRKDHILLNYIETGSNVEATMGIDEAYVRLGIDPDSPDENVIASFNIRLGDAPDQISDFRAALKSIADSRDSSRLRTFLATGSDGPQIPKGESDWPVGLQNIGNTCYLNSLLQFYFTVKPLREVLSQYEEFQENELTDEILDRKRVGGRKVTKNEIERAKRFVIHLQKLFKDMVNSPLSSVTPENELARLALNSSRDDNESQRPMSLVGNDTAAGATGFIGPLLPSNFISLGEPEPKSLAFRMDIEETRTAPPLHVVNDDVGSDRTLVDDSEPDLLSHHKRDGEDYMMVDDDDHENDHIYQTLDKENQLPDEIHSQDLIMIDSGDGDTEPLLGRDRESASSDPEIGAGVGLQTNAEVVAGPTNERLTPPPEMPDRPPPPVPPRPEHGHSRKDSEMTFGLGRQQDVTECIENVMFQIESALRPEGFDEDGEQLDVIKRLFYGQTKQSLEIPGSSLRHKEEYFSHLLIDVATGNRDIYSALDSMFDVSSVDLEGKEAKRYLSLTQLPPILQIQIQRVQYNRETKSPFKSEFHLKFPELIYLDRYVDNGNPDIATRREETWRWKSELAAMAKRKKDLTDVVDDLSMPQLLKTTGSYLQNVQEEIGDDTGGLISPEVLQTLESQGDNVANEMQELDSKIESLETQIELQFEDLKSYGYRIHSIFIHRGSVSFGHYWIYIYDFERKIYRKYNDGYVTKVEDENEVFGPGTGQPATPYFLVFVKEGFFDQMEAVCRDIPSSTP